MPLNTFKDFYSNKYKAKMSNVLLFLRNIFRTKKQFFVIPFMA